MGRVLGAGPISEAGGDWIHLGLVFGVRKKSGQGGLGRHGGKEAAKYFVLR